MEHIENNKVTLGGKVVGEFTYSHEMHGEKFYLFNILLRRLSGTYDVIPVMVSDRLMDVEKDYTDCNILVSGQFRSYNKHDSDKNRLLLSVFAREISFNEEIIEELNLNDISLDGYICKAPIYRETPLNREITDVMLAVNRPYGKSDYIPCICWGRNARFAGNLDVGTHIKISGRIQSREYQKKLDDGDIETRTTYEVSVSKFDLVEEEEEKN